MNRIKPPIDLHWDATFFAPFFPYFRPKTGADITSIHMTGAKQNFLEGHYDISMSDRSHLFNAKSLCKRNHLSWARQGHLSMGNLLYGQDQVRAPVHADLSILNFVYFGPEQEPAIGIEKEQSPFITASKKTWADALAQAASPYLVNCTNNYDCIPHEQIEAAGYQLMPDPHYNNGTYDYYLYRLQP